MACYKYSPSEMENMAGHSPDRYSYHTRLSAQSIACSSASSISSTILVELFIIFNLVIVVPVISIFSIFIFTFLA